MKQFVPEVEQIIEQQCNVLLNAMISEFVFKFGHGKLVKQLPVTEFERDCRWWIEPPMANFNPNVRTIKNVSHKDFQQDAMFGYSTMTNLPVEKVMLSLTVEGDTIEIAFMPRVIQRHKAKPQGIGRKN